MAGMAVLRSLPCVSRRVAGIIVRDFLRHYRREPSMLIIEKPPTDFEASLGGSGQPLADSER
jgi:hypothetical protein